MGGKGLPAAYGGAVFGGTHFMEEASDAGTAPLQIFRRASSPCPKRQTPDRC